MANRLKMEKVYAIIWLLEHGWSHRRIARELGIDRGTVSRYARLRRKCSKPAISTPGTASGRLSLCDPFREIIMEYLEIGLQGQRIWQDLSYEHGFTDSYSSVKRFIRRLGASQASSLPPHVFGAWLGGSGRLRLRRMGGSRGRQETPPPCPSRNPLLLPQELQRTSLRSDHGELHPLYRERLQVLWRGHKDHCDRQPEGRCQECRLVRSRSQPQGTGLHPALRRRLPSNQTIYASSQG